MTSKSMFFSIGQFCENHCFYWVELMIFEVWDPPKSIQKIIENKPVKNNSKTPFSSHFGLPNRSQITHKSLQNATRKKNGKNDEKGRPRPPSGAPKSAARSQSLTAVLPPSLGLPPHRRWRLDFNSNHAFSALSVIRRTALACLGVLEQ